MGVVRLILVSDCAALSFEDAQEKLIQILQSITRDHLVVGYVRYPLSFRQAEDIFYKRGIAP